MIDEGKIAKAVEEALRYVGDGGDRFVRLMEFIEQLTADSKWAQAEIALVQTRVSRALADAERG